VTAAEIPRDESVRLSALRRLGLLDSHPEERFDRITRVARRLFDVPIALVSLVDADRQWFKSNQGLDAVETPRDLAFCAHAILGDGVMTVDDATLDPRFADSPLVVDQPNIRFYAGCPISSPDGAVIGTLCIIDREPRVLAEKDRASLRDMAGLIEREIAVNQLAVDDELTGLVNRRGFNLVANQALAFCARQDVDALVVFSDVNDLKGVNDRHGHEVGDQLIRAAASAMATAFRQADVVARLGGDEFAACLVSYAGDEAKAVERLQAAVDGANADLVDAAFTLSMAVGTARFDHRDPLPLDALLRRADASMYADKKRRSALARTRS
jgi:diguanylate cyclase (GGDEF)-like protein